MFYRRIARTRKGRLIIISITDVSSKLPTPDEVKSRETKTRMRVSIHSQVRCMLIYYIDGWFATTQFFNMAPATSQDTRGPPYVNVNRHTSLFVCLLRV